MDMSVVSCPCLWCPAHVCGVMAISVVSWPYLWCHGHICGVMAMSLVSCPYLWWHGHVCGVMAILLVSWPCLWCHGQGRHVCKVSLTSRADLFLLSIGAEQTNVAAPEELQIKSEGSPVPSVLVEQGYRACRLKSVHIFCTFKSS